MLAACLSVCLLVGGQPPAPKPATPDREPQAKDKAAKPVTLADVIKGLGLDEAKVEYIDEPPGRLARLSWEKVKLPGTDAAVDVDVFLTTAPFSERLEWDIKKLRDVTVQKVTIVPPRNRK